MGDFADWTLLVQGLRTGDRQATHDFWERYGADLQRVAANRLPPGLRARIGPEDVVQSVCRTFLRRAQGGEFQLEDSEGLWRLLCAITLTKVNEQTRFHLRKKRGLDQEERLDPGGAGASSSGRGIAARGPSPEEAAEFTDLFQNLLQSLEEEERQVVELKLQDLTNEQVADQLQCSERTVRRIMKRVQERLTQILDSSVNLPPAAQ